MFTPEASEVTVHDIDRAMKTDMKIQARKQRQQLDIDDRKQEEDRVDEENKFWRRLYSKDSAIGGVYIICLLMSLVYLGVPCIRNTF